MAPSGNRAPPEILVIIYIVLPSAGSIPDSYDIYRYLNLVRYSIFDTRYFRRKCNFVYIFRGYLKRLRHKKCIKKITIFQKKNYETLRGKRNPEFFSRKSDFFIKNPNFFIENPIFFPRKSDFFRKHTKFGGWSFAIYYFSKHTKSGVWSLSEFPCFIVYAARNIPSISDTMWCKAGFILRMP